MDSGVLFSRPIEWQHDFTNQTGMVISNNARARWTRGQLARVAVPVVVLPPSLPAFDPTNPATYYVKTSMHRGWEYRPDQTGLA